MWGCCHKNKTNETPTVRGLAADNKNSRDRKYGKYMYDRIALTDRVVYPLGYLPRFVSKRYFLRLQYRFNMSQLEFTSVAYPEKSKGRFNIN